MHKLTPILYTGRENQALAPADPLNPAMVKAIIHYLDTYPEPVKSKVLAALGSLQPLFLRHGGSLH